MTKDAPKDMSVCVKHLSLKSYFSVCQDNLISYIRFPSWGKLTGREHFFPINSMSFYPEGFDEGIYFKERTADEMTSLTWVANKRLAFEIFNAKIVLYCSFF